MPVARRRFRPGFAGGASRRCAPLHGWPTLAQGRNHIGYAPPVLDADDLIDVLQKLDPLSELPRTGWLLAGIRPCESIADHSHGVAVAAMLLVDQLRARGEQVDGERVLRMALLHDAAEAATGDVPMPQKTPAIEQELHRLEERIVGGMLPADLAALWKEAENPETLEARVVKAADKIQMMVKVLTYDRARRGVLDRFWRNPRNFDDRGIEVASEVFDAICARAGKPRPR